MSSILNKDKFITTIKRQRLLSVGEQRYEDEGIVCATRNCGINMRETVRSLSVMGVEI